MVQLTPLYSTMMPIPFIHFCNMMFFSAISHAIQQQWLKRGLWSRLLTPLSDATARYAQKKRFQYLSGKRPVYQAPVPVIVVGNIFVGGTGKTPLVIALAQELTTRGFTVGIVSRGYGVHVGKQARFVDLTNPYSSTQTQVSPKELASYIGDEPSVLAQYAPIAVHPQRAEAVKELLKQRPDITVIISDDGLQHYALARDIEIVVQDTRRVGNGMMLPAGPLREPVSRLRSVDFIVTNYNHYPNIPIAIQEMMAVKGTSTDTSDDVSTSATPSTHHPQAVTMYLTATEVEQISTGKRLPLAEFITEYEQQKLYAIAGIGNPERFYQTLQEQQLTLHKTKNFTDHYAFQASDLQEFNDGILLMTTKDASKCRTFAQDNYWAVHVQAKIYPFDFFEKIVHLLQHKPHPKTSTITKQSGCCSSHSSQGGCGCSS